MGPKVRPGLLALSQLDTGHPFQAKDAGTSGILSVCPSDRTDTQGNRIEKKTRSVELGAEFALTLTISIGL